MDGICKLLPTSEIVFHNDQLDKNKIYHNLLSSLGWKGGVLCLGQSHEKIVMASLKQKYSSHQYRRVELLAWKTYFQIASQMKLSIWNQEGLPIQNYFRYISEKGVGKMLIIQMCWINMLLHAEFFSHRKLSWIHNISWKFHAFVFVLQNIK